MPRLNNYGEVALNFDGAALGARHLTHALVIFQQPVNAPDGPWQMATRTTATTGRGDALPNVAGGCNDLAAGGGQWMRRLDGHNPLLSGSQPWPPPDGYVGDIDRDGRWLTVAADGLTLTAEWGSYRRESVQGGTRYLDGLACWTDGGRVAVHDWMDGNVPVQQVGPGAAWAVAFRAQGVVWVCYQTDAHGGVIHPASDASRGYRYGVAKSIYDPDVLVDQGIITVGWASDEGQRSIYFSKWQIGQGMVSLLPDEGQPIPVPPLPPVEVPPVPTEPLAISISTYTTDGVAPLTVMAFYEVTGARGSVDVVLTIDGQIVATSGAQSGSMSTLLTEPGEYRLGAIAVSLGRRAETGAVRIVRVEARPVPPQPPTTPPTPTGKDAYTLAATEARRALDAPAVVAPVLSIRGRQFYDGDTLYVPRWVSGLTLLAKSPKQQDAYLAWAVRTGFNGVRVFAGALTWANQTPASALAALPGLLGRAYAHGLAVEVTALTDTGTGYDARAHVAAVVNICSSMGNHVALELANEIGHGSQSSDITTDRMRQWGREIVPAGLPWAVGATLETDEPHDGVYPAFGGSYSTAHLDRGRETWNQVRRVREIYAIAEAHGTPAINNEPIGADEKHGGETGTRQRWNDPAMFFALGALDRAFGTGGVHHSQAGLMAELPGPVQQQCADAYVAAHRAIDAVLPGVAGDYKNVGHDGSPVAWTPVGEQAGAQANRIYSFIRGDKGVSVVLGGTPALTIQWANGWRQVREVDGHTAHDGRRVSVVEIARQ